MKELLQNLCLLIFSNFRIICVGSILLLPFAPAFSQSSGGCGGGGGQGGGHGGGGNGGAGGVSNGIEWFIRGVHSADPNDIQGPKGYEAKQWVSVKDKLRFKVRFENDPKIATAPAQNVYIHVPVDPRININSLQLSGFGFGNHNFKVPENSSFYSTRLDVRDSLGLYVDFIAGIDITKNEIFWTFKSIDPATGMAPADALKGFLPVNDTTINRFNDTIPKTGEGYVTFLIAPKKDLVTGDTVAAKASIIFDTNEVIPTNTWVNTIDAVAPSSKVESYTLSQDSVTLTWAGQDDEKGTGIREYSLYMSENGGVFNLWKSKLKEQTVTLKAAPGSTYRFFTLATDNVGNQEALKSKGDIEVLMPTNVTNAPVFVREGQEIQSAALATCYEKQIELCLTVTDVEGGVITYSQPAIPGHGTVSLLQQEGGVCIQFIPAEGYSGADSFSVMACDESGACTTLPVAVTVYQQTGLTFAPLAGVRETDEPFTLTGATPAGGVYSGNGVVNGSFSPSVAGAGIHTITYTYVDTNGCTQVITQTIAVNGAPVLTVTGPTQVNEGNLLTRLSSATDVNGDAVIYSLVGTVPDGASINPTTGTVTWTPSEAQGPGQYTLTVRAIDSGLPAMYDEKITTITVSEVNEKPLLATIGNKTIAAGVLLTFTLSATDADIPQQSLQYSANILPDGAIFNRTSGEFSWMPAANQAGTYQVVFGVSDGQLTADETVTITVTTPDMTISPNITAISPNSGPVGTVVIISGSNFTGVKGVAFNGVEATVYTVDNASSITATVPNGATTGYVSVVTSSGTAVSKQQFKVTVPQPPAISSFKPSSGPIGTEVTISGKNFLEQTTVSFAGVIATEVTVLSPTSLTARVPVGAKTGEIGVATSGGSATSKKNFTVTGNLASTQISTTQSLQSADDQNLIAYPNPFTGSTKVRFALQEDGVYTLALYDMKGALVKLVKTGEAVAGERYEIEVDGKGLAVGTYLLRLQSKESMQTIRLVFEKR